MIRVVAVFTGYVFYPLIGYGVAFLIKAFVPGMVEGI